MADDAHVTVTVRMAGLLTRQGSAQILAAIKDKKLKAKREARGQGGWKIPAPELRKCATKNMVTSEREAFDLKLDAHLEVLRQQFLREQAREARNKKVESGTAT